MAPDALAEGLSKCGNTLDSDVFHWGFELHVAGSPFMHLQNQVHCVPTEQDIEGTQTLQETDEDRMTRLQEQHKLQMSRSTPLFGTDAIPAPMVLTRVETPKSTTDGPRKVEIATKDEWTTLTIRLQNSLGDNTQVMARCKLAVFRAS